MAKKVNDNLFGGRLGWYALVLGLLGAVSVGGAEAWQYVESLHLNVYPSAVIQGDPVMVVVSGTTTDAGIVSAKVMATSSVSDVNLHFFPYKGAIAALYGTDINQSTGTVPVVVDFADGRTLEASFAIGTRAHPAENLPIPAQLGGNSAANQRKVVAKLAAENYRLTQIRSTTTVQYWDRQFQFPIEATPGGPLVVTDVYGYNRQSGAATITHKGVDFRAATGTPVYAINAGVVRQAAYYTIYGNTVIVDHGDGVLSLYMHLTDIGVKPAQHVEGGDLLGHSGETGYSEGPHLHLSIRVGGVSIDPLAFYALFGLKP